tara:strand:- start:79542 stop:79901 length:360 start_codon:yes stop_codon:yes gene_type:complete
MPNQPHDIRIEKLPRWVREMISGLEREVKALENSNDILRLHTEIGCSGRVRRSERCGDDVKLPDDAVYKFSPETATDWKDTISVQHLLDDPDVLRVSANGGTLEIEPRASNAIFLRVKR